MRRIFIKALVLLFAVFSSCERDLTNVKLPDFIQKLVINSFISPRDSVSFVSIRSNRRIYGYLNSNDTIGQVSAVLSDGTREISLTRIDNGFTFRRSEMKIEEGETYSLTVRSERGMQAEASCTVPVKRPVPIQVDTSRVFFDYGAGSSWEMMTASVYMTDYAGEDNYYRFACKEILYNQNYLYYPFYIDLYPEEPEIFTDNGRDGQRFLINSVILPTPDDNDSTFLVIYILQTDKEYYTYHRSLDNYSGGDTPFTEISPAYSNIEGGLGIFASYVVDSLVFRLE